MDDFGVTLDYQNGYIFCNFCEYKTSNKSEYNKHVLTSKHEKMDTMDDKMYPLDTKMDTFGYILNTMNNINYICDCGKKYKYSQGLSKHKKCCFFSINIEKIKEKEEKIEKETYYYDCKCGKKYKYKQGLSKHKKTCTTLSIQQPTNVSDISNNIILEIVKQNKEFKELIIEQNKENQELQKKLIEIVKEGKVINNITNNNNNNNNSTNTTNKFNLQFFLNEQCKDALNIMDFMNSLQLKLSDLDSVGKLGYTESISKIFIRALKELDIFKRPIHCSDLKRDTIYIKDQDIWQKEDDNKKLKTVINHIANQNVNQIPEWINKNPESTDYDSKKHMEYIKIVGESMGAITKEEEETNFNKIIKNISREIAIEK